ncbi:MAG: type II toxin-antitoxin system VapC family toxin [Dehalococcoidia bacterium]
MNDDERFVDTGYWLAILNNRDQYHERALTLSDELRGPFVTTEAVLFEVGNSLSKPPWRALANTFFRNVANDPSVRIVHSSVDLYTRAVALYLARPDKSWGLTDCLSFVVMQDRGIYEALSADHDFEQAGFRALLLD